MNKLELWRQRRRERGVDEPAPADATVDAAADEDVQAPPTIAEMRRAEADAQHEDTVPAAFYRSVG